MMTRRRRQDETLGRPLRLVILGARDPFRVRRLVAPLRRQRPVFPIRPARVQIPDLDLGRTQTPLLIQGFGFPRIARFLEQSG